jgi:hypothetical protein
MWKLMFALLLLVGCSTDDPTFMKVCPRGESFVYPIGEQTVSTACDAPLELKWPSMPLKVALDSDLSDYDDSLNEAFAFWERGVGDVMFVHANIEDADVVIVLGSAGDPGLAATSHYIVGGKLTATIEIRKPGDITEMLYVMAHELGHVVDLAHDPNNTSIMNSTIEDVGILDEDPEPPFPNLWVTDNDHDALRALYF